MQKKVATFFEQWMEDRIICRPEGDSFLLIDQKDARYCPYHKREGLIVEQCDTFMRIFYEKHKAREILFK